MTHLTTFTYIVVKYASLVNRAVFFSGYTIGWEANGSD